MEPIVIDLTEKTINENWFSKFSWDVATILKALGQNTSLPVTVRGSTADVRAFAKMLGMEKRAMDSFHKTGLSSINSFKTRAELDRAIREFTNQTGIPWPLK